MHHDTTQAPIDAAPSSLKDSPLARWWRENPLWLNEACIAAAGDHVTRACELRRLLREVAQGKAAIDDGRLRGVVGELIRADLLELVREHRAWEGRR